MSVGGQKFSLSQASDRCPLLVSREAGGLQELRLRELHVLICSQDGLPGEESAEQDGTGGAELFYIVWTGDDAGDFGSNYR